MTTNEILWDRRFVARDTVVYPEQVKYILFGKNPTIGAGGLSDSIDVSEARLDLTTGLKDKNMNTIYALDIIMCQGKKGVVLQEASGLWMVRVHDRDLAEYFILLEPNAAESEIVGMVPFEEEIR